MSKLIATEPRTRAESASERRNLAGRGRLVDLLHIVGFRQHSIWAVSRPGNFGEFVDSGTHSAMMRLLPLILPAFGGLLSGHQTIAVVLDQIQR